MLNLNIFKILLSLAFAISPLTGGDILESALTRAGADISGFRIDAFVKLDLDLQSDELEETAAKLGLSFFDGIYAAADGTRYELDLAKYNASRCLVIRAAGKSGGAAHMGRIRQTLKRFGEPSVSLAYAAKMDLARLDEVVSGIQDALKFSAEPEYSEGNIVTFCGYSPLIGGSSTSPVNVQIAVRREAKTATLYLATPIIAFDY